jgi:hypothetical protein
MSEPPTEPIPLTGAEMQAQLATDAAATAEFLRGNAHARHVYALAYRIGHSAGWAKGYAEGRAVRSAYDHASGCPGDHDPTDPCYLPEPQRPVNDGCAECADPRTGEGVEHTRDQPGWKPTPPPADPAAATAPLPLQPGIFRDTWPADRRPRVGLNVAGLQRLLAGADATQPTPTVEESR